MRESLDRGLQSSPDTPEERLANSPLPCTFHFPLFIQGRWTHTPTICYTKVSRKKLKPCIQNDRGVVISALLVMLTRLFHANSSYKKDLVATFNARRSLVPVQAASFKVAAAKNVQRFEYVLPI